MALPQVLLPPGFPPFLRDGHAIELIPIYGDTPMSTGADRRRRNYTSAPRYMDVTAEVDRDILTAFKDFFENTLSVGAKTLSVQVQNQGPGLLWWKARFFAPYKVDYLGGVWWRISARLILFDEGSVAGPDPTGLETSVSLVLQATATLVATQPLITSVVMLLEHYTIVVQLQTSVTMLLLKVDYASSPVVASSVGSSLAIAVPIGVGTGLTAGVSLVNATPIVFGKASGASVVSGVGIGASEALSTSFSAVVGRPPGAHLASIVLEDGISYLLLEDGTSSLLLE